MGLVRLGKKIALRAALRMISNRMAPDRIPLSAPGVYARNYFSATISGIPGRPDVLVSGCEGNSIRGYQWNGGAQRYEDGVLIGLEEAILGDFDFTYYRRQYEFRTSSPARLWAGVRLGWYRFLAFKDDSSQGLFNRRTIQYRERMQVLQELMAAAVEEEAPFVAASTLVSGRYGARVVFHPLYRSRVRHTDFLLQSLAASGLAERDENLSYRIAPGGFAALDAFNTEERRHRDSVITQKILVVIGGIACVAGLVQAVAAVKQAWPASMPPYDTSSTPAAGFLHSPGPRK